MRLGKQRGSIVAVADVGSSSAAVAILELGGGVVRMLAAERTYLPSGERPTEGSASGVIQKLGEAGESVMKKYTASKSARPVTESYVVIRAPWVRSQTIRVHSKLENDVVVTDAMIAELAKGALAEAKNVDSASMFEVNVIKVLLNGYPTQNPKGKKAHHIEVAVLISECPQSVRSGILETLSRIFPGVKPVARSGTRAFFPVLKEYGLLPHNGLIATVTDGATDLVVIRKGDISEHELVPEGIKTILAKALPNRPLEETMTRMRLLATNECEDAACTELREALARVEPDMVKVFGQILSRFAASRRIANTFILSTQADFVPWFSQFFSRIDFAQFTTTTRPFIVKAVSQETLFEHLKLEAGVASDIGLAVAAALVNIEEKGV